MLSIQIDSKNFRLVNSPSVEQHQIVLFCKPYEIDFPICTFIDAVRLLDTQEYITRKVDLLIDDAK